MVSFDYLPEFERRAKALAEKYRSFADDYNAFLDELERNPFSGTPLGGNTYKHRMAIASKGKGKSGGARVITYNVAISKKGASSLADSCPSNVSETNVQQTESHVIITLMSIYDKSEIDNVSDTYLRQLVKEIESRKQ